MKKKQFMPYFKYHPLQIVLYLLCVLLFCVSNSNCEDFFDEDSLDDLKTSEELIFDSQILFQDDRPLEARSKLLKVLAKDPKNVEANSLLGGYYLVHVGHFRMALKYVKQSLIYFKELNGPPPYLQQATKSLHSHLLNLLSQTYLNLDNYKESLKILDEYKSYGYYASWYPGSRAWVLMKMGKLNEAIKIARAGILGGAEPGRTLNMLGILLSMTDKIEESIETFKQAVAYEFALGAAGQPATPLNNVGEVFKEIFDDDRAEKSFLRATSLQDGCEHVLPSLNLAMLYLDQLQINNAQKTIDTFESCVAQFPLRNGEEHRALVHLIRGRIAFHRAQIDSAIEHFSSVLNNQQWFGKIGTTKSDLEAAARISLAIALLAKNSHLSYASPWTFTSFLTQLKERILNYFQIKWNIRKANQILIEDSNDLEDLYIRNTDSLLEYSLLGIALREISPRLISNKLSLMIQNDHRQLAKSYYQTFLADVYSYSGKDKNAVSLIRKVLKSLRKNKDRSLYAHNFVLLLKSSSKLGQDTREAFITELFNLSPSSLLNFGIPLPVNFSGYSAVDPENFSGSIFKLDNVKKLSFLVTASKNEDKYSLSFLNKESGLTVVSEDKDLDTAIKQLIVKTFSRSN